MDPRSSVEDETHATTTTRRKYRPVDVATWGDGFRVVIGWVLITAFAVVIGGLSALYEVKVINVEDRDVRDMSFDFRVTTVATDYYHRFFINGIACCNMDSVVFPYSNTCGPNITLQQPVDCPGIIVFECYLLTDVYCNQTRSVVYAAMGLSPSGAYSNCMTGGKLRVGSSLVPSGRQTKLTVFTARYEALDTFGYDIFDISDASVQQEMQIFIQSAITTYGTTNFILPASQLPQAVYIDGQQAPLSVFSVPSSGNIRTIGNWPSAIFDFPGMGKRCPNTGNARQYYMSGTMVDYAVSDFNDNDPQSMVSTVSVFNATLGFAQWSIQLADSGNVAQASNLGNVNVYQVSSVEFSIGMVAALGPCYGWLIDSTPAAVKVSYGALQYSGPATGLASANLKGATIPLKVTVRDVSAPIPIALPPYSGMWYLVISFGMAALWLFPTGFFILFGIPLIWWNVRSNKGLAPIVYRYLKSYRGW